MAEETDAVTDDGADHDTAAGIFRHLIHRLDDDTRTVSHDGLTFWVATCGAMSVPTDRPDPRWAWCGRCWPSLWPTDDPEEDDS